MLKCFLPVIVLAVQSNRTLPLNNGVVRMLRKSYAHQRETTGPSSDSLRLRPFSKWELLLRKEFAHRGSKCCPLKEVVNGMKNHFNNIR